MIDEESKIWAAGFFDGESSALIEKHEYKKRLSFQIVVAVSGTDEKNTSPVMEMWGGRYRKTRDISIWNKGATRLDCSVYFNREEARVFLADIYPYLRGKQREVAIVLQAIVSQEKIIKESGLRGSSIVLEPYYTHLREIRESPNNR